MEGVVRRGVVVMDPCRFDDAIEMYQKALTEDNNRHTRTALNECKHMKEKYEREVLSTSLLAFP